MILAFTSYSVTKSRSHCSGSSVTTSILTCFDCLKCIFLEFEEEIKAVKSNNTKIFQHIKEHKITNQVFTCIIYQYLSFLSLAICLIKYWRNNSILMQTMLLQIKTSLGIKYHNVICLKIWRIHTFCTSVSMFTQHF